MYDVILVDGNNFARRALHSHDKLGVKKESGKIPTGMMYGFLDMIANIHDSMDGNPNIYVVWDKGRNKRNKIYPGYKGSRDKVEKDPVKQKKKDESQERFKKQMFLIKPILTACGMYQMFVPGEEADDVIGTLSKQLSDSGKRVLIATGDHDMFQLIRKKVDIYLSRPGGSSYLDISNFEKKMGIAPEKIVDMMALMGDSGDDIPGIKGIGESKAKRIVNNNPDLVQMILDGVKTPSELIIKGVSAKEKEMVVSQLDVVKLAHSLVKIDLEMQGVKIIKPKKDNDRLEEIFEFLEFNSFLRPAVFKVFERIGIKADVED